MQEVELQMKTDTGQVIITERFEYLGTARKRSNVLRKLYGRRAGKITEIKSKKEFRERSTNHITTHIMIIPFKYSRITTELPDIIVHYSVELDFKDYGMRSSSINIDSVDIEGLDLTGYTIENELEFAKDGSIRIEDVDVYEGLKKVCITSPKETDY